MTPSEPIDIHLVTWNRPRITELTISTIHRNTKRDSYRLVVFDNGSNKETVDMLNSFKDEGIIDELVLSVGNIGLEAARQRLLSHHTKSEYFICADNDCLPMPYPGGAGKDWVEKLYKLMMDYKEERYAAISASTQVMIGTGNIFEEADATQDNFNFGSKQRMNLVNFPHPGGSLRIMDTVATRSVGGWDRQADGRGSEEKYICGKLRGAGYQTAFAVRVKCLHLFGLRDDAHKTDRWGYDKDWSPEKSGHSDIWHPALGNGDDIEEVRLYAGDDLTNWYFHVDGSN